MSLIPDVCMFVVHYKIDPLNYIKLGDRAVVMVYDHPIFHDNGGEPVLTSQVVEIEGNRFKTKNNIYKGVLDESCMER